VPIRLKTQRLYAAAELLGDTTDLAIRDRTGITPGTFSRLVHHHVEPKVRYLELFSHHYTVPIEELYEEVEAPGGQSEAIA